MSDTPDFETALKRLEEIVTRLENGELTLDSALQLFEEGIKLSRFCHTRLEEAERRVEILLLRRSEEHTSELQSRGHLVCRLLLEKKKIATILCALARASHVLISNTLNKS